MKARHEKAQAFLGALSRSCPELPFEPTLLPELFASTAENSSKGAVYIAELVERSQGLAARILRTANSAYYGMQTKVSSLTHAIRLLGLNEVRSIIMQIGVGSALSRLPLPKDFPFKTLWEHQLFTANFARAIGRAMPGPLDDGVTPDDLYAAGLLHDLGKTMIAASCPEDWAAINLLADEDALSFFLAEDEYWGIDHSIVGARLLTFWGIPARLSELVNWHHAPELARPADRASAQILAVANIMAHDPTGAIAACAGQPPALAGEAAAHLPAGIGEDILAKTIAASCDVGRIRGMALASMGN